MSTAEKIEQEKSGAGETVAKIPFLNKLNRQFDVLGESAFVKSPEVSDEDIYARRLRENAIPGAEKEKEAQERGLELLLAIATNEKPIFLNDQIGFLVKEEVRDIRKKKFSGQRLQDEYARINKEVMASVLQRMPESQKKQLNGFWELGFITICKRPDGCGVENETEEVENGDVSEIAELADMIDLGIDWEKHLDPKMIDEMVTQVESDVFEPAPKEKIGNGDKTKEKISPKMFNELQELRFKMGRAMKSGRAKDWDALTDDYIRLMDYLPQYIVYRIAVEDLVRRTLSGQIKKMPEKILSVAAGPYSEARAESDFDFLYKAHGLKEPEVYNLDFLAEMLKKGKAAYGEYLKKHGKSASPKLSRDIAGDMRKLPIKKASFEMVECSSLDNLIKKSPLDLIVSISEMARVLKIGGVLRLSYKEKLHDEFYKILENLGLKLLTAPHTTYDMPESLIKSIEGERGKEFTKRLKQKLGKNAEYILAVKEKESSMVVMVDTDVVLKPPTFLEVMAEREILRQREAADRVRENIERLLKFVAQNPHKGQAISQKIRLMTNLALSFKFGAADGIMVQGGKVVELDKKVRADLLNIKYQSGGQIPQAVSELMLLDRKYRVEILSRYASKLYRELVDYNIL